METKRPPSQPDNRQKIIPKIWVLFAACLVILLLITTGYLLLKNSASQPSEAPEVEKILEAQTSLPFQVLIPAYLPRRINRAGVLIDTNRSAPGGEPMLQMVYPLRIKSQGTLTLQEWLPKVPAAGTASAAVSTAQGMTVIRCNCHCTSQNQCDMSDVELSIGALHIRVQISDPGLLTAQELQVIFNTLGPAANRQVYSSMKDVPVTFSLPPAVAVPINAQGVQEVTLVVLPEGYNPAHFSVKKGVPVRLIFRQLGQVGCGDELILTWGNKGLGQRQSADLKLASAADKQVFEFTPQESGDFQFNCPHQIYRGAMTVTD
jgi:hypothetical protein